ncbi:MAG: B12-binding domain-containing radical SAM protein [Lachnospiraceae bacterium]|nr:B12-binding domain-containing radical SAM protein [Lachnospiraceae bacterium]
MKFLLVGINSKYIHTNQALKTLSAYTESVMGPDGRPLSNHLECVEYTINQQQEQLVSDIYQRHPDVIGISCYIWNVSMVEKIIPTLKKLMPAVDIWLGGPEASYKAHGFDSLCRGIMRGEGERIFAKVLGAYVSGSDAVAALPFVIEENSVMNLDDIPFPYYNQPLPENKIVYYESSRGCPFRCSYCLSSIEKTVRFRSLDLVKNELKFFLDNRVKQVKFVDRTFNINHDRTLEIWEFIQKNDNGITNFHFEISADLLNDKELLLLSKMRPGAVQLETGVQSTNATTLNAIHRFVEFQKIKANTLKIQAFRNTHQHLDLIAGLPYEDYESFGHSFDDVYQLRPDQLQLGFLKLLQGSEMAERADDFGIVCSDNPPYEVLYTKWLTYDDVLKLKRIEQVLELYYNSSQYNHTLRQLEQAFSRPFELYEALSDYFRAYGYTDVSKRRLDYYEILLAFACEKDKENSALYKELLTLDCYLRENLKSRPSFVTRDEISREDFDRIYREAQSSGFFRDYGDVPLRTIQHMTHLEFFAVPSPHYVLFDYSCKDPITFECRTINFPHIGP